MKCYLISENITLMAIVLSSVVDIFFVKYNNLIGDLREIVTIMSLALFYAFKIFFNVRIIFETYQKLF